MQGAGVNVLKGLNRKIINGPSINGMLSPNKTMDQFFDTDITNSDNDYQRVAFFDQSNAMGFSTNEDKLGRLAQINKTQLDQALRDINNFAQTDAGFKRKFFPKSGGA